MNCNMMFRVKAGLLFILVLLLFEPFKVHAADMAALPKGDVLLVYSDGASEDTLEAVYTMVEILTWQGARVSFAPASECMEKLGSYGRIIFYEVLKYPKGFPQKMLRRERGGGFFFIGSGFLKEYLDKTARAHTYTMEDVSVYRASYDFEESGRRETLIRENRLLFLTEEYDSCSGSVETETYGGYLCASKGAVKHMVSGEIDNPLIRAVFSKEVSGWWKADGGQDYQTRVIVLNRAYPFQDQEKLYGLMKQLADAETPFAVSVMPVYQNEDYPAMRHFCEILRYAQANGGMIVLHAPVNRMADYDVDAVNEAIALTIGNYVAQGVYPLGIQIPRSWMLNEDAAEVVSRFQTVLVSEEEDGRVEASEGLRSNPAGKDGHNWIAPEDGASGALPGYMNTCLNAVYIDMTQDEKAVSSRLKACLSSVVPVRNLWDMEHRVWTASDSLTYRNGMLSVNGETVKLDFVPAEYEEQYAYRHNMLQRFSLDLTEENRKLLLAVGAVSVLFVLFILAARRSNRKRFYYEDTEEEGEG